MYHTGYWKIVFEFYVTLHDFHKVISCKAFISKLFKYALPKDVSRLDGALHAEFFLTVLSSTTKTLASLQLEKKKFSSNLEGLAQKMHLLRPFDVLDVFSRKSISKSSRAFIFGEIRYLVRSTTGGNLVLIPQTTFEKLKIESFLVLIRTLVGKKIPSKN